MTIAGPGPELFRPALEGLVPYEPGKPAELVQRELGLDRVVKLASNEGPFGPFPQALEAIEESLADSNRYPDGGAYRLRAALAEHHGVAFEETVVAAGADAVIGYVCQATLDPGDEVVTPWPSFPSYVLDPLKLAATPVRVPLRDGRVDVDDLLAAVTPRTKLAYLPTVNNPTGTMTARTDFLRFLDGLPPEVLTVVDEAYFEYVDDPELPNAIEEAAKQGRHVLALRPTSARRASSRRRCTSGSPGKLFAYNCSPSFNWRKHLDDAEIASFRETLAGLGYRYQFVTLAGFHSLNAGMFELARGYAARGMPAYVELQEREFALEEHGYTATRHQREVGAGYFDRVLEAVSGGQSSTLALKGSTEEAQFAAAH